MAIPIDDEWETVTPQSQGGDDEWETVNPSQPKSPSLLSQAGNIAKRYADSQLGSPQDLLMRADSAVRSGFNKMGEFVSEDMAKQGIDPRVTAGIGTAVAMGPDIAAFAAPSSKVEGPKKLFRDTSRPLATRSMGLTKMFQKTPFARGKAAQAADVALEQKIIPFSGDPKEAMRRAVDLQKTSGEALGSMRESAGTSLIDPVFDSLEAARQRATGGLRGGAWDMVHKKFDEAQDTLLSLVNRGDDVPLKEIERVKKLLSNTVNWVADNVSQETAKQISGAIESGVENIMRSKGIDMAAYAANKRLFGASKTMQKGLSNEIAAQAGNNAVSLPSMVMGAGQLATGNVPAAAATLGLMEGARRRGAGFLARSIDAVPRQFGMREPIKALTFLSGRASTQLPQDPMFQPIVGIKNPEKGPGNPADGSNSNFNQPNNYGNEQQNQNNQTGNIKSLGDQKTSKGVITEAKAREYLKMAGGDKKKARQLALADGWEVR